MNAREFSINLHIFCFITFTEAIILSVYALSLLLGLFVLDSAVYDPHEIFSSKIQIETS